MFIAISDEAGDTGLATRGGTQSLVLGIALFPSSQHIELFNESARRNARTYLDSPLRKWSELKGKVKNNPDRLYGFFSSLVDHYFDNGGKFLVFSFFILDKPAIERANLPYVSIDDLKREFRSHIANGYVKIFKRIFAFSKKYHFVARKYRTSFAPKVVWYIDRNDSNELEISNKLNREARKSEVNLDGPYFIAKRGRDKEIATAIKVVDIFTGAVRRTWEEYRKCRARCKEENCLRAVSCFNGYMKIWRLIHGRLCSCPISIEGSNYPFWHWQGVLYYPAKYRRFHVRFLGEDPYFGR